MSLLEQIQVDAVDARGDLGSLLRTCKLLAVRLKSEPLEQWLCFESEGYPEDVSVPDYRIWEVQVKGHFYGPAAEPLRNVPVPALLIPDEVRDAVTRFRCRQSIGGIEETLAASNSGVLRVPVADLALLLGPNVYAERACAQAWIEFETDRLVEISQQVRHRVLDFALRLWKLDPLAGELTAKSGSVHPEQVNHIFRATVAHSSAS